MELPDSGIYVLQSICTLKGVRRNVGPIGGFFLSWRHRLFRTLFSSSPRWKAGRSWRRRPAAIGLHLH